MKRLKEMRVPIITLREDYEIGIFQGEFSVEYCGQCSECGFKFEFKHSEKIGG